MLRLPALLLVFAAGCATGQVNMSIGEEFGGAQTLRPDRSTDVNAQSIVEDEATPEEDDPDSEDPDGDDPGGRPEMSMNALTKGEQRRAERKAAIAEKRRRLTGTKDPEADAIQAEEDPDGNGPAEEP
jgi:hypothetical protein